MQDKNYILKLPQINVSFDWNISDGEFLLIAGGRQPNVEWLKKINLDRPLWCIDHGIDFCRENNFIPKFLIGDFDSANGCSVDWAIKNKVQIERHPVDKDLTDTQLTLKHLEDFKDAFAIITGVFGGRFDHLYSTILSCANAKIKNCLVDEREAVIFLNSRENLKIEFKIKPLALSLLPMTSACHGVSIDGVHWPLNNATLYQSFPNAVSNRIESDYINASLNEGILAIYICFDEA